MLIWSDLIWCFFRIIHMLFLMYIINLPCNSQFSQQADWHSREKRQSQMVEWLGLGPTFFQQEAEEEAHEGEVPA